MEVEVLTKPGGVSSKRTKEESELLGLSVAHLQTGFLLQVESHFGVGSDPAYDAINRAFLSGPRGRGRGLVCPRDGLIDCSYVDAVDSFEQYAAARATVMLSWSWAYTARTVVESLSRWCVGQSLERDKAYVWQCALCCNQYRVEARKARQEWEPFETFRSLFQMRVCSIGRVVALLAPWDKPLYTTRMWCVFELCIASQIEGCKLEIILPEEEEKRFVDRLGSQQCAGLPSICLAFDQIRIQAAQTSSPDDRANILRYFGLQDSPDLDRSPACDAVNAQVVSMLRRWLLGVAKGFCINDATGICKQPLRHLKCLSNALQLFALDADWHQCDRIQALGENMAETAGIASTLDHAELLIRQSHSFYWRGDIISAIEVHDRAGAIFDSDPVPRKATIHYVRWLKAQGAYRGRIGSMSAQMHTFQEAHDLFTGLDRDLQSKYAYAGIVQGMGTCQLDAGNFQKAREYFERAYAIDDGPGLAPARAVILGCIARLNLCQQRIHDARAAIEESLLLACGYGCTFTVSYAVALQILGICHCRLGEVSKSREALKKAIDLLKSIGQVGTINYADVLIDIGILQATTSSLGACSQASKKTKRDVAVRLLEKARGIFVARHSTELPRFAYLMDALDALKGNQSFSKDFTSSVPVQGRLPQVLICLCE